MKKDGPKKTSELVKSINQVLEKDLPDDQVRRELEALAEHPSFPGLTWLWGPILYARNRVLFRPFVLGYFSTFLIQESGKVKSVEWTGPTGQRLQGWLEQVDELNDLELFRRLYVWKNTRPRVFGPDSVQVGQDLTERFTSAQTPARRRQVLDKFDFWFILDESTALNLYRLDPDATRPFILRRLPRTFWYAEKRKLWNQLAEEAAQAGDEGFYYQLYRRQVPVSQWKKEVLQLCDEHLGAGPLVAELEKRHPNGHFLDLGDCYLKMLEKRGRDVLPYVTRHLQDAWNGWWRRSGFDAALKLARERDWLDFWALLVRTCARPDEFDREIAGILDHNRLRQNEKVQRLVMLAGPSREWNAPAFGLVLVKPLKPPTAIKMFDQFPELLRGPFKVHVASTWGEFYPGLIRRLMEAGDENLLDYLAGRTATRAYVARDKNLTQAVDILADYYQALKSDEKEFSRRASRVLTQIPAYSIYDPKVLIRENRLARLFFSRSTESLLADEGGVQDLVEAPEIHVQALAYRLLGQDDPRAEKLASENLDVLIGVLLRPLKRRTRIPAFGALKNAGKDPVRARRILDKAREALDLPDEFYPKEQLIGLIGQLLHQHPELRSEREHPMVFGEGRP